MYINDKKIIGAIEHNLGNGRFVIFPYGTHGQRVKQLLNKKYHIKELAIVDNKLSEKFDNILNINEIQNIEASDYIVLFAVSNPNVYDDLLEQSKCFPQNSVCDIASLQVDDFFSMCSDKLNIEDCDNTQRAILFNRTKQTWMQLGSNEPYWSVLTDKKYLIENITQENGEVEAFYESGRENCQAILKTLLRNSVIQKLEDAKQLAITEIGCGTGRVTQHLARFFGKVTAIDVSLGNIRIASEILQNENVLFRLYKEIEDYDCLPMANIVYSIMVLQHNVPPVIEHILNAMLKSLKPEGVAFFQIPTYKEAYEFNFEEYIKDSCIGNMEMHLLPQKKIFEIAYANGCIPLEVYQDGMCAQDNYSCTFVLKKLGQKIS